MSKLFTPARADPEVALTGGLVQPRHWIALKNRGRPLMKYQGTETRVRMRIPGPATLSMGILTGARLGRVCLVLHDEIGLLVRLKASEGQKYKKDKKERVCDSC